MDSRKLTRSRWLSAAAQVADQQYGVLSWEQARACGLNDAEVRKLRRSGEWLRLYPRVYCIRELLVDPENPGASSMPLRTRAMAAQLALGPHSFASVETAARLCGLQGLPQWDGESVHMTIPALGAQRHIHEITLHSFDTLPDEVVTEADGIRRTSVGRTLRDTVLRVNRECAVSLMDSSLNQGFLTPEDFPRLDQANKRRRGRKRTSLWWELSDGRAQSPLETRVRLVFVDGGMPPDKLQYPLYVPSLGLTYFADLWWEETQTIVEADGAAVHESPRALYHDRKRQNAILQAYPGTRFLRFTWTDLNSPKRMLAKLSPGPR